MKDISMPILIVSAVIVALASSITALTVNPTGNVMGYYSLQAAGTQIFYDEFNDLSAWTGNINSTMWHTTSSGYNSLTSAFKDAYGSHYISHTQSTVGYSNITISFAALNKLKDAGESFRMDWYDGVWWTSTGSLPRNSTWTYYSYNLPASAANNPNFAVKFICYDWHTYDAADWCQVDAVKITGVAATQTCSDGTPYTQCSTTKPKYCSNGNLVDLCPTCGCPTNQVCNATTNVCYTPPQVCSDGTSYNQCSQNKPLYCSNGTLIINCVTCGCSSGYSCNITSKICYTPLCNDGTAYDQCSATKPNYCQNGSLILNCNSCGCPTGKYCDLSENSCYSQLIKVNMLTQDVVYTTNNYLVKLDSVVQSGNVYYGIFTVTNSSGQSESSTLLTNGITYYFFNNRIGITVQEIGYDLTLFKGVTNITVTKTFPKVKMYTNDIVYTMQNYKIKFTSVSLSNGKYYGIFTATNPSQQTETSTLLTNGITYHFFNNEMGITINEIGYDFDLFKGVTNITVH